MGGGMFDDGWDAYANPWAQPNPLFHRSQGPVYGAVPQDRAFQNMDEPKKKKRTVKIVPVGDGGAPAPQVPVKQAAKPVVASRFESSDAAATKIQTVFRGYVVRKTKPLRDLRVIRKVEEELEDLKNKLQIPAQRQKLYNESTERLRWTEGVMALLLRLDSLQGVHPEVRLIRRALTKELIQFQEAIDGMSTEVREEDDVISTEDNDLTKEHAEVIDLAALEGKEFEETDSEELSALGQGFTSGGADEVRESDNEVPTDVEIKERVLTMERPHPVEEREMELANILPRDVETLNQEVPLVDVSGECTPSREVISEPISEFVSVTPAMNDAEVYEQATVTGRGEDAENMVVEEVRRPALDTFVSGDVSQETAAECRDQGEGFVNPASDSLLLEPPWLQAGQPQPQPSTDGLSDHALLLQVLEENRKLKDVVGKVLQWGNQKDNVIQNLLSRIEHLEERQPSPDLLHCEESDVPKKNGRWSEKGRKTRYPVGYVDPEDSLSAGSSDWFSDDFLW